MRRLRTAIRSRLTLGRLLIAVVAIAAVLALASVLQGADDGSPSDDAVRLVPGTAVVYVHLNSDRDSSQWKNGARLMGRFPLLVRERNRLLRSLTGRGVPLDFEREVEPWLGDEAALALIPDRRATAHSLILLRVSDKDLARSFLERAIGKESRSSYRGIELRSYGALATAFIGDFLAIGRPEYVRAAIDTGAGRELSLARLPAFRRAHAAVPDRDRLLFAYATRTGAKRVLAMQPGIGGRLVRLVDDPALLGVAGILSAEEDGARVDLASALDDTPAVLAAAARRPFTPQLVNVVSEDALAYLGMLGADRVLNAVARFAGGKLPFTPELRQVRADLRRAGGLRALRQLEPLLKEEAALFVSRSGAVPVVTLVVDDVDKEEADQLLTELSRLLARLARRPPEAGRVPTLEPTRVAGVDALTLRIGPALELTYAIFDNRVVVATSPGGIRRVKLTRTRLTDNELFAPGMRGDFSRVSSVVFLDLEQLLALGEQAGLGQSSGYERLRSELGPVRAVTAIGRQSGATTSTEIFIEVP